jgi:hypothetical protein
MLCKTVHIALKIEQLEPHKKTGFNFAWNWIIVVCGEALFAVKKKIQY